YHASIQSEGDAITVGAIASTRKMCAAASLMNQESRYLQALQAANRMALGENGFLYIYVDGNETPLRFSRMHGQQA
ncbi:MAG TPA: META domain-containing protein, partial [Synechococcales cyanobacterium M55_K2018_004]|nr:META domain-containing protein [Synechococcales cyanobacterium M55_K2018_004]